MKTDSIKILLEKINKIAINKYTITSGYHRGLRHFATDKFVFLTEPLTDGELENHLTMFLDALKNYKKGCKK